MSLTLITHLYLAVRILYKCKTMDAALNCFSFEKFTKISQNRDAVSSIRTLESHEV